jgi:hypothetical protein
LNLSTRRRHALVTPVLLAAALAGAGAGAESALATGTVLDATYTSSKPHKPSKARPSPVHVAFSATMSKPGGDKPDAMKVVDMYLPRGIVALAKGFGTCPYSKLETNQVTQCPASSVVGTGTAAVDARPVLPDPIAADIVMYNVEPAAGRPVVGLFIKARGLQITLALKLAVQRAAGQRGLRLHAVTPHIKTVPGLPDGSMQKVELDFGRKGRQGYLFRATAPCSRGWAFGVREQFFDGSAAKKDIVGRC